LIKPDGAFRPAPLQQGWGNGKTIHASEIHSPVLKCMGKSHGKLWWFNALRHLAFAFLLP
jgi:hypothetical protein